MKTLSALVLCGGLGTRLQPVIGDRPKVLAPVAGRPFLDYVLSYLNEQGIATVILGVGYGAPRVREFCQDGARWHLQVVYSEERELLGTAGAVRHAARLIGSDPFWVLNGDSMANVNFARQERFHRQHDARITLALVEMDARQRFGAVNLEKDGAVRGLIEKGIAGRGLVNAGIYLMNKTVLDAIPALRPASFEYDVFPRFVSKGLFGLVAPGPLIDIGVPEGYALAQTQLAIGH